MSPYSVFDDFFSELLKDEGGYSNNPADSGGETMYGITAEIARVNGWSGSMKDLPLALAKKIFKEKYWDILSLDDVQFLSPSIVLRLADISVNLGPSQAGKFCQTIVNVLNNQQRLYQDVTVDGVIGPKTIKALKKFLELRQGDGELVFVRALNCLQGSFYIELAKSRPKDEAFVYGWLLNRIA